MEPCSALLRLSRARGAQQYVQYRAVAAVEIRFRLESPPAIHFKVASGAYDVLPNGVLVVNRSAIVHLFCFYPKEKSVEEYPRWVMIT